MKACSHKAKDHLFHRSIFNGAAQISNRQKSQILDSASNAYGSNRQCKSQGQVQHTGSPADEVKKCRSGTVGVRGQEPRGVRALFILFSPASSFAF